MAKLEKHPVNIMNHLETAKKAGKHARAVTVSTAINTIHAPKSAT